MHYKVNKVEFLFKKKKASPNDQTGMGDLRLSKK